MELTYCMPTRILSGRDCVVKKGAELAAFGKKALIVTGSRSAKANGSLDDVLKALASNAQEYCLYDRVMSNPTIACAYQGAAFAKQNGADFVIAIGGGSPMDAAKAMALLACQDIPEAELFSGKYGTEALPIVCVPTTAGTGSEVTQYSILTNDKAETKTSIATALIFPKLALLDAKYLSGLNRATAVNTVVDALSHAIEGMLSVRASELSDLLACESIRLISSCFTDLSEGTLSFEQLERLLYASTLAGMVIANTGTTAVHAMGYSLTYFKNVDHGRANGLLLGEYLKFAQKTNEPLVRKILAPMKLSSVSAFKTLMEKLLGEKETLTGEEIARFSAIAAKARNIPNSAVAPSESDIQAMFTAAFIPEEAVSPAALRHYDLEFIRLENYIPAAHFRTVPSKLRTVPGGPTEIRVEMEVSQKFAEKLPFPVGWDGKIWGYVHDNESLKDIFSGDMATDGKNKAVYINDWGENFLVTFENRERNKEVSYFVLAKEVSVLLNTCRFVLEG